VSLLVVTGPPDDVESTVQLIIDGLQNRRFTFRQTS
jgi:hypothetical protein